MSGATTGAVQTTGPVVFDYTWFQARYPDLSNWVSPEMGQFYFDLATLYLNNSENSSTIATFEVPGVGMVGYPGMYAVGNPISNIGQRQMLLGLLTAHIATLNAPLNGKASSGLVGRISSATEGSVSVSVDYPQVAGAEWFSLTKYGLMYWQATAMYRKGRYYPAPQLNPYGFRMGRGRF